MPKSGLASSIASNSSFLVPPPTRTVSARSAKIRANASILDHDTDIDALIRKHDKKGARGFKKARKEKDSSPQVNNENFNQREIRSDFDIDEEPDRPIKGSKSKSNVKRAKETFTSPEKLELTMPPKKKSASKSKSARQAAVEATSSTTPSTQKGILASSSRRHNQAVQEEHYEPSSSSSPFKKPSKSQPFSHPISPDKPDQNLLRSSSPLRRMRSPNKQRKGMSENQITSFLENYDLEAENRLRLATKTLQISIDSARTQMHAKVIARLPRAVRLMKLGEFVKTFGADVNTAIEQAAVKANEARQGAWEEEKLQRKRKGEEDNEEREDGKGKNARIESADAPGRQITTKNKIKNAKNSARKGKNTRQQVISDVETAVGPSNAIESTVRPPSAAQFLPQLNVNVPLVINQRTSSIPKAPATPASTTKSRAARAGEQIQWTSLNGSPIVGIIAPDGTIHAMPRTLQKSPKNKNFAGNWETLDEENDAAETSANVLELAHDIENAKSKQKSNQRSIIPESVNASPTSRLSLHTAMASRRATGEDFESAEEGESLFEEARSVSENGIDDSLPDEEAYTAQILREEAQKRNKMSSSDGRIGRSSTSSKAFSRSSGAASGSSSGLIEQIGTRASHSTLRAGSSRKNPSLSNSGAIASSPVARKFGRNVIESSSPLKAQSSSASMRSTNAGKGKVSIAFGSGTRQQMTRLAVEDLMKIPSKERQQMIDILQKIQKNQELDEE